MHKVLVPYDGSAHSKHALEYVIGLSGSLARPLQVHLLNVQASPVVYSDYLAPDMIEGVKAGLFNEANRVLAEAVVLLKQADIAHQTHVDLGNVADQVKLAVPQLGCDTVVMGTRGLGSFGGLLLGSVANRVIHEVSVPVILIK
ncbi:universal stress protein [Pseudomonas capsici]|uniref:Universal stress protein n=1 Tax=Pseudomonas capsici TaxID=2810614 RepID=A0ABT3BSJ9_9PSED|nr:MULTISPECIES: universal stress protein [Pseudomonas]MBN6715386.1 universal stress protein [Pseudomonas capsici]MBN6720217.1 universal stress protein [Pseudomonas capsici]MBN6725288.1 universal stress protein [Pseudomonas capsici]MBX8475423.1 universal stress protein [Pseudomonas cichorii]MBX8606161.1 universal stress protein [Pseudomonas cichorii]